MDSTNIPIVTEQSDLDAYVGKLIILKGMIANSRIPTISGVDVNSDDPDLRGEIGEATGILEKWTVTEDELNQAIKEKGMFANRGPGTFYRLKEINSDSNAQVKR